MVRILELKLNTKEDLANLGTLLERRLKLPKGALKSFVITKESIDARKKPNILRVLSVDISAELSDEKLIEICKNAGLKADIAPEIISDPLPDNCHFSGRPVIVGFGPCGMFAALSLAMMGAKPIVLERGASMDERVKAVETFWNGGPLDPNANCQFGEGGAGTFSDGKLTTGTKSEFQRFVLEQFALAGANPEILFRQKPHIGTDVLRTVVVNIRKKIESLGGEVLFKTKLAGIDIQNGKVCAAILEDGKRIETESIVLALGHSARDTVRMLNSMNLTMEQKQFSMGLRIEHPQDMIDKAQYGAKSSELGLGPADYKMNVKTKDGRGVYTFCMCPGGVVVNASSFEGGICCNGMSYYKRDSGKANSALLADVRPSDFGSDDVLAGVILQEKYEALAYKLSNKTYTLPKETLQDFVGHKSKLKECLPGFVYESLVEALPMFGRKLKGFDRPDAMLYGIEARSSSPVRIVRSEEGLAFMNGSIVQGLYPAGEGAGYAGGIMSAACDGVRVAVKIVKQ